MVRKTLKKGDNPYGELVSEVVNYLKKKYDINKETCDRQADFSIIIKEIELNSSNSICDLVENKIQDFSDQKCIDLKTLLQYLVISMIKIDKDNKEITIYFNIENID